ncbi:MAG TPA: CCA tRNA nucleotidyltransferase [Gemmatimonadales bacterium]|nr:CCA tRNA nucleotidyltransferase [Gemmatimonadales bacterium]
MTFPATLDIPPDVMEIARTLEAAGHEAWCVGGAVRDTLLGVPNTDYDVATSATPEQVKGLFRKTIAVGERFGTVGVYIRRRTYEVTTFRRDVQTDGRHAVVEYGASLDEDLARRDFTINAIAYHPLRHEWRDPFHGAGDLEGRRIRAVGSPAERFREDYLRILRGLRFAARFDFAIEPDTWVAMQAQVSGLGQLSAERVHEEWFKGLMTARSLGRLLDLWVTSGAAAIWLPELLNGKLAARANLLPALEAMVGAGGARDPVLLTILLCLDPVAALVRLKSSRADIARAAAVLSGAPEPDGTDPVSVRRWMAAVGEAADDLITLWQFQHGAPPLWAPVVKGIRERGEPLTRKQMAVTGDDLRQAGFPPGPEMGLLLDRLLAAVVDDPSLNSREVLLSLARTLA